LDKVLLLLSAIEAQQKTISYYALDLSDVELTAALENIPTSQFQYVRFAALHGTFDDGLRWLREAPGICDMPHHILLFGLTLGNYSRPNAAAFLKSISEHALSTSPEQSSILVTLDSCKVPTKVLRAYTCEGVVPFALTALQYGNTLLRQEKEDGSHPSHDTFHSDDWHFLSEWNYVLGRHEASLIPRSGDLRLGPPLSDITVRKEEKVRFGCSYKYDKGELETLFGSAGLENLNVWSEDGCNVAFYELKLSSG
jgi:4-dimethylallyltryptophan N-methyltransferase